MSRQHPKLPKQRQPCDLPSVASSASFWHKEPSALLKAHRSTRNLPETADIVIIGSGMTGTSIAHHLLTDELLDHEALDVVLLEAREACWGATGRNGGHCQPILFENPHDPSIGEFELRNYNTLRSLIDAKNIDCEFIAQPGVRGIYSKHHLDEAELALHAVAQVAPQQAALMKIVTNRDELNRYRVPTALGAVVTAVAARMWPYKFVTRILEDLVTSTSLNGTFNLQTLTPVDNIHHDDDVAHVTVQTARGSIRAKRVILATNAYTSHLLPSFTNLIVPCRGQMSALVPFPSIAGADRLKTSMGFLGDGLDDYLVQRDNSKGGHLMFGGGRQHGPSLGTTDDSIVDEKTAHYLRGRLVEALNLPEGGSSSWTEMDATHIWSGIMGFSRDDVPWVGRVPDTTNIFMAAGYTGHGMPNTWLCGKAVAMMALGDLIGKSEKEVSRQVKSETGLPTAYRISEARFCNAHKLEDVESRDWAEMDKGRRTARPASGYA